MIKAFAAGIYPRSAELVQATRDLDRGRTTRVAVAGALDCDREAFVGAQGRAGLDLVSDGMLGWQDLFRPLVERTAGVEARPLVRFLDTNTFFRGLIVSGQPRLLEPVPPPELSAGGWVGVLPSPYALAYAASFQANATAFASGVLDPQIEAWLAAGAATIVLDDPFIARDPDRLDELAAALDVLPALSRLVLRLPFSDAGPLLGALLELPVDGVGVDFYATSIAALPRPFRKWLHAGVLDVRSSRLEDPAEVARFAERLAAFEPEELSLGPNGDLQFVPEPIARQKIERLGEARQLLEGSG